MRHRVITLGAGNPSELPRAVECAATRLRQSRAQEGTLGPSAVRVCFRACARSKVRGIHGERCHGAAWRGGRERRGGRVTGEGRTGSR